MARKVQAIAGFLVIFAGLTSLGAFAGLYAHDKEVAKKEQKTPKEPAVVLLEEAQQAMSEADSMTWMVETTRSEEVRQQEVLFKKPDKIIVKQVDGFSYGVNKKNAWIYFPEDSKAVKVKRKDVGLDNKTLKSLMGNFNIPIDGMSAHYNLQIKKDANYSVVKGAMKEVPENSLSGSGHFLNFAITIDANNHILFEEYAMGDGTEMIIAYDRIGEEITDYEFASPLAAIEVEDTKEYSRLMHDLAKENGNTELAVFFEQHL